MLEGIYTGLDAGSKLRQWAVDQLTYELRHGTRCKMTGIEDFDDEIWVSYARDIKDFGQDFVRVFLHAGAGLEGANNPYENRQRYMKVLTHEKDA
jgi:hypothetical protein